MQPEDDQIAQEINKKQSELNAVTQKIDTVSNNLALAETKEQRAASAKVFDKLVEKKKAIGKRIA